MELLAKDFSNFRNDLQYQDLSIRIITEMFNECEKERISKFVDEILLIVAVAVCALLSLYVLLNVLVKQ